MVGLHSGLPVGSRVCCWLSHSSRCSDDKRLSTRLNSDFGAALDRGFEDRLPGEGCPCGIEVVCIQLLPRSISRNVMAQVPRTGEQIPVVWPHRISRAVKGSVLVGYGLAVAAFVIALAGSDLSFGKAFLDPLVLLMLSDVPPTAAILSYPKRPSMLLPAALLVSSVCSGSSLFSAMRLQPSVRFGCGPT